MLIYLCKYEIFFVHDKISYITSSIGYLSPHNCKEHYTKNYLLFPLAALSLCDLQIIVCNYFLMQFYKIYFNSHIVYDAGTPGIEVHTNGIKSI